MNLLKQTEVKVNEHFNRRMANANNPRAKKRLRALKSKSLASLYANAR